LTSSETFKKPPCPSSNKSASTLLGSPITYHPTDNEKHVAKPILMKEQPGGRRPTRREQIARPITLLSNRYRPNRPSGEKWSRFLGRGSP
jgi:hypothetical protein